MVTEYGGSTQLKTNDRSTVMSRGKSNQSYQNITSFVYIYIYIPNNILLLTYAKSICSIIYEDENIQGLFAIDQACHPILIFLFCFTILCYIKWYLEFFNILKDRIYKYLRFFLYHSRGFLSPVTILTLVFYMITNNYWK